MNRFIGTVMIGSALFFGAACSSEKNGWTEAQQNIFRQHVETLGLSNNTENCVFDFVVDNFSPENLGNMDNFYFGVQIMEACPGVVGMIEE